MKIGVGLVTYNRRDLVGNALNRVLDTAPAGADVVVAWDDMRISDIPLLEQIASTRAVGGIGRTFSHVGRHQRSGVAGNKNRALRFLLERGCDWIVLVEDDVEVLQEGWVELLVDAAIATEQAMMSRVPTCDVWPKRIRQGERRRTSVMLPDGRSVNVVWNFWASATVQAINAEALLKVGMLDERFGIYGHEHTEFQCRLQAANLVDPIGHPHICLEDAEPYFRDLEVPSSVDAEYATPAFQEQLSSNGALLQELVIEHKDRFAS